MAKSFDYNQMTKEELVALLEKKRDQNQRAVKRYQERHPERMAEYWLQKAKAKAGVGNDE